MQRLHVNSIYGISSGIAHVEGDLLWSVILLKAQIKNESHSQEPRQVVQDKFDWGDAGSEVSKLISYGPCQFPTLGLIVQRAW